MIYFDRFDIAEAYYMYGAHWNRNGVTTRDRKRRRHIEPGLLDTVGAQLHRLKFRPAPSLDLDTLSENGRAIYDDLVNRHERVRA